MSRFVMADTTQLSYIKEVTWGTTPASPAMQVLRLTSESLTYNPETVTSQELSPDRNIKDQILTSAGASGGMNFEFSYGAFDGLLESLFYNDWNNDVLVNGLAEKSLTLEKRFYRGMSSDASPVPMYDYFRFRGMVVNTMNLNIAASEIITGDFDFMGKGAVTDTEIIAGETYLDAPTEDVLSASYNVGTLTMSGFTSPKLASVSLSVTNNLQGANVVGSHEYADIGAGTFAVSGSIEAFYDNLDMYHAFLEGTASSLAMTIGKKTGQKYTIEIPKLKFSSGEIVAGGQNQYVMANMNFQGLLDATLGGTMKITRGVA